ncbi:MAG TPA: TonB-dependent receptor [Steroidobacteraceae bacterium]|nr:TonB-dependent receptor [Steroidobacteraceae bacterium]
MNVKHLHVTRPMLLGAAVSAVLTPMTGTAQAADNEPRLEEITVTAQRREQNLQDTPLSIAAFGADALVERGMTNLRDVTNYTPNVEVTVTNRPTAGGSAYAAWIRGVGTGDYAYPTDPGVGLYVDGVYLARTLGGLMSISDIERIEVLRGPQGTLYGRNTIGGAINVITSQPNLSGPTEGSLAVRFGEDGRLDAQGHVNGALVDDRVGGKLAFGVFTSDGYGKRLFDGSDTNDEDRVVVRGGLRVKMGETSELDLRGDFSRQRNTGLLSQATSFYAVPPALVARFNAIAAPVQAAAFGLPAGAIYDSRWVIRDAYATYSGSPLQDDYDIGGASATITISPSDAFSFKSISAWRTLETKVRVDGDTSPFTISSTNEKIKDDQLSQEFQVSGALFDNRFRYLAGAFYFREDGRGWRFSESFHGVYEVTGLASDARDTIVRQDYESDSVAIFTQEEFDITPTLTAIVGARANWDDKTFTTETFLPQLGIVSIPAQSRSEDWFSFTPRVGLNWRVLDDVLLYASYAEGFKSGGFGNPTAVLPTPVYGPEKLSTYELGGKSTWLDGRLTLNGALFFSDWTDIQLNVIVPGPTGGVVNVTQNGGDAQLYGLELESTFRPTTGLTFNLGVGYTHNKFVRLANGVVGVTYDTKLPHVPEWTASLGAQYKLTAAIGDWTFRTDASYRSDQYLTIADPTSLEDSYTLVNARIAFEPAALRGLELAVEGSNLTDKRYLVYNQNATIFGIQLNVPGAPRQVSAIARYRF